jgi:hypothetical protein
VDVAAPGVNILSTIPGGYASYSGTSMATPFATGVVSLLAGQNPGLSASALVQRVVATVKPLPSLVGRTISGGMVDAYNALTGTLSQAQSISASVNALDLGQVENAILATDDVYQGYGGTPTSYVTGLYQAIFDRAPDPTGLAYYSGLLESGSSRQDVVNQLQGYDEARRTLVARWYQEELGWADSVAALKLNPGVVYWASLIDAGQSIDSVHAQVLSTGVYPGRNAAGYVAGLYQTALGRFPDPDGLAYFAGQVDQGVSRFDVALQILTTDEGRRTAISRFYQDVLGSNVALDLLKFDPGVDYWASLMDG